MGNNFDLFALYQATFGSTPYFIKQNENKQQASNDLNFYHIPFTDRSKTSIDYTTKNRPLNKKSVIGKDIWHPLTFWESDTNSIEIEACTIGVNLIKTVITTAVSERKGAVHETFNIDDYKFNIKGFLIGKDRFFPEDQITMLKTLFETTKPLFLKGGYPELFLEEYGQVIITALDFPEVEGKSFWIKPFTLTCMSDFIQDLILD